MSDAALARQREEEAHVLETLILAMRADVGEVCVVTNCLQAIVSTFWIDKRCTQTMLQQNSFGRRAIKRSGPDDEDLLATVVRILRHFRDGAAPPAPTIGAGGTGGGGAAAAGAGAAGDDDEEEDPPGATPKPPGPGSVWPWPGCCCCSA